MQSHAFLSVVCHDVWSVRPEADAFFTMIRWIVSESFQDWEICYFCDDYWSAGRMHCDVPRPPKNHHSGSFQNPPYMLTNTHGPLSDIPAISQVQHILLDLYYSQTHLYTTGHFNCFVLFHFEPWGSPQRVDLHL